LLPISSCHSRLSLRTSLREQVWAGTPVSEEEGQTDGLEDAGEGADGDGVERALLGEDLGDDLLYHNQQNHSPCRKLMETHGRCRAGHEDQAAHVGGALVAEGTGGVQERADAVRLHGRADGGSAVRGGGRCGLLGLEELLLGVGGLGLAVGLAEDGAEDGEGDGVGVDGAERDGGRLDGREICCEEMVMSVLIDILMDGACLTVARHGVCLWRA